MQRIIEVPNYCNWFYIWKSFQYDSWDLFMFNNINQIFAQWYHVGFILLLKNIIQFQYAFINLNWKFINFLYLHEKAFEIKQWSSNYSDPSLLQYLT